MKVGYIGSHTPYLRLQARWLERAGFPAGTAEAAGHFMNSTIAIFVVSPMTRRSIVRSFLFAAADPEICALLGDEFLATNLDLETAFARS